jgi:hypothetical protein
MVPMERRPDGSIMQGRSIEPRAGVLGSAGMLMAVVLASGCAQIIGIEPLPSGYSVRGTAVGVLGSVTLELRIGGDTELRTVTQEGTFTFETMLEDGDSYTVVLVNPSMPCTLRNETGVIAGADTGIELTCTGASLASVVVSSVAPTVTVVPGTTDYVVDLPLLQQSVTVTATVAMAGDTLTVAGTPVASSMPSTEITLGLGDNPVEILVENHLGWQRTYRLTLRRAAQLGQYAYGKASNPGEGDYFGFSVVLSGDTLAVGAYREGSAATGIDGNQDDNSATNSGAVYVFRRSGTAWRQEAYLKPSNTSADDFFGQSIALSGDALAVGALQEDSAATGINGTQSDNSPTNSGAVYVFRRAGTIWQQEAYLKPSNTGVGDNFGWSVALSDDTLAAGTPLEDSAATGVDGNQSDNTAMDSGAVYVFRRSGTVWQQEAYLKASNTGVGDNFGWSVALSRDTLAVGARHEDSAAAGVDGNQSDNAAENSGAVYVFRRTDSNWQQEAYLKASNTGSTDLFGWSVALSSDALAVGARYEDSAATGVDGSQADNGVMDSGAVYVFRRAGTSWQQEAYLKASNTGYDGRFGTSVALSGETLAVGASGEASAATGINGNQGDDSAFQSGAAYVFRRSGTIWQQAVYLKASNTGAGDYFGWSVALSGDTLAVGASLEDSAVTGFNGNQDDNCVSDSGAVYVFH